MFVVGHSGACMTKCAVLGLEWNGGRRRVKMVLGIFSLGFRKGETKMRINWKRKQQILGQIQHT